VLGDGKLGLLIAQVLLAHGAVVHLYGRHPHKMRIAEAAGAVPKNAPPQGAYQWVVEATGSAAGLRTAIQMTRPRGTVVMKSTIAAEVPIDTAPAVVNEITLVGSRCGRFEPALELLSGGRLRLAEMISERLPLTDAPAAFARAGERGNLKVLLRI
jgi:alcohol dehydrogenase